MGTLTSYVGAVDAAKSAENGSAGFSWINIMRNGRESEEREREIRCAHLEHALVLSFDVSVFEQEFKSFAARRKGERRGGPF